MMLSNIVNGVVRFVSKPGHSCLKAEGTPKTRDTILWALESDATKVKEDSVVSP